MFPLFPELYGKMKKKLVLFIFCNMTASCMTLNDTSVVKINKYQFSSS